MSSIAIDDEDSISDSGNANSGKVNIYHSNFNDINVN